MSECKGNSGCNCSYPCEKHGKCCLCIEYHRKRKELPACYFTKDAERTYNRSISYYNQLIKEGNI